MPVQPKPPIPNYYEVLHIERRYTQEGKPIWASEARILGAWRERVKATHPANCPDQVEGTAEILFCQVMEAGLCLLSPTEREAWQEIGHEVYVAGERRKVYAADPLPDWVVLLVESAMEQIAIRRGEYDNTSAAREGLKGQIELLPTFIAPDRIACFGELDVAHFIAVAKATHPELARLRGYDIDWVWRRNTWKSRNAAVLGMAKALGTRERELHPLGEAAAPVGRIEIALDHWLVMDDEERLQLIHHELLHFLPDNGKMKLRAHDFEGFVDEVAAHGVTSQPLAEIIQAALEHEDIVEQLEAFGCAIPVQLRLPFAAGSTGAGVEAPAN